jgi:serine/threonine-protein kinase
VVAGWNLELDQPVAIKFLNPEVLGARDALERFRREVRAAAKIRSEHVTRVLDVGSLDNGLPYMIMELLDGQNLEEELAARGPLPVAEAVGYVLEAIEALAEAHAASVVHRDLKPANLFISRRADRSRIVKVLDFGVSKTVAESSAVSEVGLTRTGMIVGSPLYMSPEQLRSTKTVDCRADIWALGAILFQLLTTHTPYDARTVADLCAMLLRDPPTPPSRYRTDLPLELEGVILRCLERDPDDRYQNVSALADALLPFAPASARIHAERARGVLLGAPASTRGSAVPPVPLQGLRSVPEQAASGGLLAPDTAPPATTGTRLSEVNQPEAVLLVATNGKTAASWGSEVPAEHRRKRWVWVSAAVVLVLVLVLLGATKLIQNKSETAAAAASADTAAAAGLEPLAVTTNAALAAPPLAATAAPAVEVTPASSAANAKPNVEPVPLAVSPAAPLPAPARPAAFHPKAKPFNAEQPASAPKSNNAGLSDFGGRK